MTETEVLIEFTKLQNPILDFIASILTFLGNEEFYFLIIPFIFWCVSKSVGFRLFYIFLLSVYVNSLLKIFIATERPIGVEGVNSLFVSSAEVGSHYPYDSFPSGHAQGSATLWGYLAATIRHPLFLLLAVLLILFISLSRLYTGLHWPNDIIVGIILGVVIVIVGISLQERIANLPRAFHWFLILFVPLVLIFIFPEEEGMKYAGILLGAGIGYLIEANTVNMEIDRRILRRAVAFIFGIIVTFSLQVGLKILFPVELIFDFLRYAIIGLWITFLAPYLFIKLRIYRTQQSIHIPANRTFSR